MMTSYLGSLAYKSWKLTKIMPNSLKLLNHYILSNAPQKIRQWALKATRTQWAHSWSRVGLSNPFYTRHTKLTFLQASFYETSGLSLLLGKPAQRKEHEQDSRSYARCSTLPYPDQKDQTTTQGTTCPTLYDKCAGSFTSHRIMNIEASFAF